MLEQLEIENGLNKEETALHLLKELEPPEGYYLAFSGGKDSCAVKHLLQRAGVKFDSHYCVSPIDPPQIYKFIRQYHPDVIWDYYAKNFWQTVLTRGLPGMHKRWCCKIIKEAGGNGRTVVTGLRRSESSKRRSTCFSKWYIGNGIEKLMLNPIAHFDDYDVWQYIRKYDIPYCELYDEGAKRKAYGEGIFNRLGCVLCPFELGTQRSLDYFPKTCALWKKACDGLVAKRKKMTNRDGLQVTKTGRIRGQQFQSGEEMFKWWINRK